MSPALNSGFQFKLTQHLLQGFGFAANTRFIRIAKNNRELSDVAFRLQIITTVNQIQTMYWDLVYAYENVRVQKESLAFADKTLSDTKKQVEIGSLAPIEVVRAQSTVAQDQQALTVALTNLQLEQLLMKNALSRTLRDQTLAGAEVIPTSTMEVPESEPVQPIQDLVGEALRHRADLVESRIQLNTTEISNKAVRNALCLPSICSPITADRASAATQNTCEPCVRISRSADSPGFAPAAPHSPRSTVGYGSTLNQLVNSTAPDKGVGIQLNIPLRNRAAQAVQIRSELEFQQAQMASAADREPDQHRSPQRAVRSRTEPGQRGFRQGCGRLRQAVARCRAEEISVRYFDHNVGAADAERAGHGGIHFDVGHGGLRKIARRTRTRRGHNPRPCRHQHRRCRQGPGHAYAQCAFGYAAQGLAFRHATAQQ